MSLKTISFSLHPAGYPFIAGFAGFTILLGFLGFGWFMLGLIATGWCTYFFRDPPRTVPRRAGLIVSPADGVVVAIRDVVPDADLGFGTDTMTRISIFLNVFDVHVNRIPADGMIRARTYRPGKFLNASLDKASVDNERLALAVQMTGEHAYKDRILGVVQIAGLVARRILCDAQLNNNFRTGERFGIIRFGSRADVYMPMGLQPLVVVGQRAIGGETVLADAASTEPARQGDVR